MAMRAARRGCGGARRSLPRWRGLPLCQSRSAAEWTHLQADWLSQTRDVALDAVTASSHADWKTVQNSAWGVEIAIPHGWDLTVRDEGANCTLIPQQVSASRRVQGEMRVVVFGARSASLTAEARTAAGYLEQVVASQRKQFDAGYESRDLELGLKSGGVHVAVRMFAREPGVQSGGQEMEGAMRAIGGPDAVFLTWYCVPVGAGAEQRRTAWEVMHSVRPCA
eukprot:TRINITY_DN12748_c0_g1_i1.p2 TRINITY_DN12748_c0_g1~~TRINITY_DN12748_c0_g1_i1.p2  ORF type:complete len:223 (+),score=51.29 TRINITY_DN12748_c0_g1_i1:72-740(+)